MQVNRVADVSLLVPDDSLLFCSRELDISDLQIETNYDLDLFYNNEPVSGDHLQHSGWYTVYAYNVCGSVTDSVYVEMQEEQYFYVPNSFTPNSDGKNELFSYSGANIYIQEVIVFNRWGQQIYVEKDGFSGWDGTYRGKLCPDGIYQVQIVYADCFGILKQFNGHVNLLK
jgi:gliding motility-associated-like protein